MFILGAVKSAIALSTFALLLLQPSAFAATAGSESNSLKRLDPAQLRAVQEARQRFTRERQTLPEVSPMPDFRAVIHVHAEDADHTLGTRDQVLAAAKKTGVQVVLVTDHRGPKPETWRGLRDGVLFMAGAEDTGAGVIRFPEFGLDGRPLPTNELRFLSHIEERLEAPTKGLAGMEICNRHSDAVLDKAPLRLLAQATNDPAAWARLVENCRTYPDEFFAAGSDLRREFFTKWDAETQKRRFPGIGANDSHQNVVLNGVTFDPYEVSFRNLSTHLFARELSEPAVREALREGRAYVSHDWLCDPTGFVFGAVNNLGVFPMGSRAPMQGDTRVMALTPLAAHLKLFFKGALIAETNGTNLTFKAKEPGPYRLEAWLDASGEERPWIYSNPVYLEETSILTMRLPNAIEAPGVTVKKNITYVTGKPEDEPKHKLDVYAPPGASNAPVFFFAHGGAWRFGDRWQYPPFGHRMAKEGIVTVILSYRLAPKNPHPAQIDDVAAAFAWTMRNVTDYGGDTNRVFVAGHSAGAHLVSLLTLHDRYLARHGLTPKSIRGVIALSGVYDLTIFDSQSVVFGNDKEVRRDASPQFFIRSEMPPFFVSYCEWDYPTLPAQAKRFHAALKQAGISAELFFTPRDNHIYEMISMTYDDDVTAQAVLRFMRSIAP